ncbi:hypothetical protein GPECTOR_14g125 [Gonium pectorale]|uniref:EF-hand domain-containing protein n=1 Tax=Gonium pectorale TaxID=33097 RepID=A0A150GM95_GONPE|nr:hypothetical protein GPECTOR_14g125 [Gonium pectorale]|eukprot:KXZ50875.1 hypothetical protein GPECTOR_14g125 [Gonium pectorale]
MTGVAAVRQARPVVSAATALGGGSSGGCGGCGNGGGSGGGGCGGGGPEQGPSSSGNWGRAAALVLAGGALLCGEGAAWAAKKAAPVAPAPPKPAEELTVDKKVGQLVAVCVGLGFLFVQALAYTGFVTVNWSHVHTTVHNILDVNKDGKVDAEDFKPIVAGGLAALSQGIPSVGGFLAGFMLAIRSF